MFERLLFKNEPDYGGLVNIGALAEALLFYRHVEVICNSATLEYLCKRIPPAVFVELVKDERISVYLLKDQLGVQTEERTAKPPLHSLIKIAAHVPSFEESAERAIRRCTTDRRLARTIVRSLHPLGHDTFDSRDLMSALLNVENTSRLVAAALATMVPAEAIAARPVHFRLYRDGEGFALDSNLDFADLDRLYHHRVPSTHSSITPAWLISLLQGAKENLYFAANFRSEVANGRIAEAILREDVNLAVEKLHCGSEQIEAFNSLAMDGHSLRDAINNGSVSFLEFLKVLDRADRFRDWIATRPPDSEFIREYYWEATRSTWIERLPGKTFRWLIFTGLGAAVDSQLGTGGLATVTSQALSAFDTFVLEKLIGGWKPSQFVDQELIPLASSSVRRNEPQIPVRPPPLRPILRPKADKSMKLKSDVLNKDAKKATT